MKEKIVALAGRRVDNEGDQMHRFPPQNRLMVRQRILAFMQSHPIRLLVCSAACGADLLALDAATELGIAYKIVLPFKKDIFKEVSVTDRSGDWGKVYDQVIGPVLGNDRLTELNFLEEDPDAFAKTNKAILEIAQKHAARSFELVALLVWDGNAKDEGDLTFEFAKQAKRKNIPIKEISTL